MPHAPGEQFTCRGCSRDTEARALGAWAAARDRLRRKLRHFPDDQRNIRVSVEENSGESDVRLTLALPSATLSVRAKGSPVEAAVADAGGRMIRALERHTAQLRGEHLLRRTRRERADLAPVTAQLASERQRDDRAAFIARIRPHLRALRPIARHELRLAELEDRIEQHAVGVDDVLDEVLVRTWDRFEDGLPDEPLDLWLGRVLHDAVDALLSSHDVGTPVYTRVAPGETHLADDDALDATSETYWPESRPITLGELLPDLSEESDPEGRIEAEALQQQVLDALRAFAPERRRAFALSVFEGWSDEEIAMLLKRTPDDVRDDIALIRARLRPRLAHLGIEPPADGRPAPEGRTTRQVHPDRAAEDRRV